MKKEVSVGLMNFSVDEVNAEEFGKILRSDLDQIDYVQIRGFDKREARSRAIRENCQKFGAEIL